MDGEVPGTVRSAPGPYAALAWIEREHRIGIDLDAIGAYRDVADAAKLRDFLRGSRTLRAFLRAVQESESDYRAALRGITLTTGAGPAGATTRIPDRDAAFAAFGRFLGRGTHPDVIHPRALHQLHLCLHKETKNNVILCGPAGTGKTTLVEQYAALHRGEREFLALDAPRLIAGTRYRGELESRLLAIFDRAVREDITLFVDESHVLSTMGGSEGSINVLDLMKPYLVRPEFRVIGASTESEVVALLHDGAFRRRFSIIEVLEPTRHDLEAMFDARVAATPRLGRFAGCASAVLDRLDRALPDVRHPDKLNDFFEFAGALADAPKIAHEGFPRVAGDDIGATLEEYTRLAVVPERLLGRKREEG